MYTLKHKIKKKRNIFRDDKIMSTSFCIKVCLYRTFKIVLHIFFLCKVSATAQ